jgi:hypothetical protein
MYTHITSRPFSFVIGRDQFLPLATILTQAFRFFHCRFVVSNKCFFLFFLLSSNSGFLPFSKTCLIWSRNVRRSLSLPSITTHIRLINLLCESPFIHSFYMTKPSSLLFAILPIAYIKYCNVTNYGWFKAINSFDGIDTITDRVLSPKT